MDNSAPVNILRITPERATKHLVSVIAVAGELLGRNRAASIKRWRLNCPGRLVVLSNDLDLSDS